MMTRQFKILSITLLLMFSSKIALAEVVVIVNPASGITSISKTEVKRIFLGKIKKIKGNMLVVLDQNEGNASRDVFYSKVVRKSESQLKSYWSAKIFSGKGTPPKNLSDGDKVKAWVSDNPYAVGYVDSSKVDASVLVAYTVK